MNHKNFYTLPILIAVLPLFFANCKKNEPGNATTDVTFVFENRAGGQPIEYDKLQYENAFGNRYSVNTLKYYISHIVLETADGQQHALGNYDLINQNDLETAEIQADSLPNGRYVSLTFNVGVDSVRNHSGDQPGELNPFYGMVWSWAGGYIFYRHEGYYVNASQDTVNLFFHLGTDVALTEVSVPLSGVELDGTSRKVFVRLDLNELYRDIDFEEVGVEHSSTEAKELGWILLMKAGFRQAFSFERVE